MDALLISLFIGVLFYGLYFVGLESSTAGNAAIIGLFEVFTSFLLFNVFRRVRIPTGHVIGAELMVLGALLVLAQNYAGIRIGDFVILFATFFSPVGNLFQQRARTIASSETIMFLRSALSTIAIFVLAALLGQHASVADIRGSILFLLVNGVLLLGISKVFWIEGIHRIPVTEATALGSVTPFLTLLVAWVLLGEAPNVWQLASLVPLVLGTLFLTDRFNLKKLSI